MTDDAPKLRRRTWATLVGTWSGRVRVFAALIRAYFQLAPVLATAVIGLLVGLWLALWSQAQIEGNSPLAGNTAGQTRTATATEIAWLVDDSAVVFYDGRSQSVSFRPNGATNPLPTELRAFADNKALMIRPAEDGVLTLRPTDSFELVMPGGLSAVDAEGSLYVTGAARIRNPDKSNERGIEATAPNDHTVWRAEVPSLPGEPMRFLPALPWDATVTAMIALPSASHIAVGGADGRIAFIGSDGTPKASANQAAAVKAPRSHGSPVVALAAGASFDTEPDKTLLASAASDGSLKIWYLDASRNLTSRDVLFPAGVSPPALMSDSLELSDDGQLLTVRTPAGAMYVASLPRVNVNPPVGALYGSVPIIMAPLKLGFATAASALSRGAPTSVYVGAPDCSIQELDISNITASPTGDGSITVASVTKKLTLHGHDGPITSLAMSRSGEYLAAVSLDGRVRIHHLPSLRSLAALPFADLPTGPDCSGTTKLSWRTKEGTPSSSAVPTTIALPRRSYRICMGNGGGQSCTAGADATYTCDVYNKMGGGNQATRDALVRRFCEYKDGDKTVLAPNQITVTANRAGGQCGWTEFTVVCNP